MTADLIRNRLIEWICLLPHDKLLALEPLVRHLVRDDLILQQGEVALPTPPEREKEKGESQSLAKDWPHAPLHRLSEHGTYIVTAGTLNKEHHFNTVQRLDRLQDKLLKLARQYGWQLEAWAVFSNHYHFVGHSQVGSDKLNDFLGQLHCETAGFVNDLDDAIDRQVWCNFWETRLTFERSYLARLKYVHHNPVKHRLVAVANQYPWCSAAWFERTAKPAQVKTIYSFKIDKIKVNDDFEVLLPADFRK
jgi:putative transposase